MKYYVMYEDINIYGIAIVICESAGGVEFFVEHKINDQYYSPSDFTVVKGIELPLEITHKQTRVTLLCK